MAKNKKTAKAKAKTDKGTKEIKVQEAQESKVIQETIIHRDLKYLYPDGCTDTLSRKAFRQKVRNHIRKLERKIRRLEESGNTKQLKVISQKVKRYREETLANPEMVV